MVSVLVGRRFKWWSFEAQFRRPRCTTSRVYFSLNNKIIKIIKQKVSFRFMHIPEWYEIFWCCRNRQFKLTDLYTMQIFEISGLLGQNYGVWMAWRPSMNPNSSFEDCLRRFSCYNKDYGTQTTFLYYIIPVI